ncbi:MAG: lamin tail domain-containing protein, partial [Planctomycetes bacterium]|nr:lamin tail domain-containing protein [Planctomycetota bacterium]
GDLDVDGDVDIDDAWIMAQRWCGPGNNTADLDGNDTVAVGDFSRLADNWGKRLSPVKINEFMANKGSSFTTRVYGVWESPDWIEIYNGNPEAISLDEWYLTDNKGDLQKWRFPAGVTIAGEGYLVVFASNKAQLYCPGNYPFRDDEGYYHTNFELDRDGEYLALVKPDGETVAHEYDKYPKQRGFISYGYSGNGQEYGYFTTPTPKVENAATYITNVVADTAFSVDRGFYDNPIDVAISCDTPGAIIRYTTDGSEPTMSNGTFYSGPVHITTTTYLRAVAFRNGWLSTNVDTQTYIFPEHVRYQTGAGFPNTWGHVKVPSDYEMDPEVVGDSDNYGGVYRNSLADDLKSIPTVSLVMSVDDWFNPSTDVNVGGIYANPEWEDQYGQEADRGVSLEFIDPASGDQFQLDSTVRIQGGSGTSNWKVDKLSMRVKFREPFGPTKLKYPLFGEGKTDSFDTFVLDARMNNAWHYPSANNQNKIAQYTRDQYASDLHNAMGGYSPRGQHVHLYINGLYWGLYNIHERPDDSFAAELFGGDKREYHALKKSNEYRILNNGNGYSASASYNQMLSVASDAGNNPTNQALWENLTERLDVDNLIDYLLANWYGGNRDWGSTKNWYATGYGDPDGKSKWRYHSWDAEKVIQSTGDNVVGVSPDGIHGRLDGNPEYRMLFADHVYRHMKNGGVLTPEGATALYQIRLDMVDRAVVGASARWGDNRRTTPYTRNIEWVAQRDWLLDTYFPVRTDIVLGQLGSSLYPNTNPPELKINGSVMYDGYVSSGDSLTMTKSDPGTIYYTLNGNDPRSFGGVVNTAAGATAYGAAVTINSSMHVKARVLNGSEWSALSEAIYAVATVPQKLRITEIMYHPTDPTQAEKNAAGDQTLTDEDFEFIEFKNIGASAINLNLVNFTDGIDFTFGDYSLGAGQFVVIVGNQGAFQARYPGVSPSLIAGTYTGSLDNNGEEIVMRDAFGAEIHDFDFNDTWFVITDGGGYSLNKLDPDTSSTAAPDSWDSQSGWRPSSVVNGTPGADDTGYTLQPGDVVISEVMTHTDDLVYGDWIEIWNRTGTPVYIGGWFLSDSELDLAKYEIAAGDPRATIAPDSYVVFDSVNDFRNSGDPGSNVQFGLSEHGEDVYLT